jgi:di/tricarboxylate transporter
METSIAFSTDMMLVLMVLGLAILLFITEWISADLTALLVLLMLGLMRLVPSDLLFAGFASNAVMAILAAMILGVGLDRTGALNSLADIILAIAGDTERRLILALSAIAGVISAFMQNPALVALLLPVAARVASRTGYPLSHLLMPMAFCVVLGGTMTTVGNSPMILLNDLIASTNKNLPAGAQTLTQLTMFSVFPIGLVLLLGGLGYFYFFGARLLPSREGRTTSVTPGTTERYFQRLCGTEGELMEWRIGPDCLLLNLSIIEIETLAQAPMILAIKGRGGARLAPPGDDRVGEGDVLGVLGDHERLMNFALFHRVQVLPGREVLGELFDPERAGVSEAVVPPASSFVGRTLEDLRMRRRYGISPLAVTRGEELHVSDLRQVELRAGDCIILHSSWSDLAEHADTREFVVITDFPKSRVRPQKFVHAMLCFALAFGLAFSGWVPLSVGLMAGAVGMVLSGVISMEEVYKSIAWKTLFLLAALVPVGIALDNTGTAAWIAQELYRSLGSWPSWAIQTALAIVATLFSMVMSQVGATVIMVPMAINIALAVNHSPIEYALVVALAASNNFVTSTNAVTTLIVGPAGYRQRDFWRLGLPLMALFVLLSVLMVNVIY